MVFSTAGRQSEMFQFGKIAIEPTDPLQKHMTLQGKQLLASSFSWLESGQSIEHFPRNLEKLWTDIELSYVIDN